MVAMLLCERPCYAVQCCYASGGKVPHKYSLARKPGRPRKHSVLSSHEVRPHREIRGSRLSHCPGADKQMLHAISCLSVRPQRKLLHAKFSRQTFVLHPPWLRIIPQPFRYHSVTHTGKTRELSAYQGGETCKAHLWGGKYVATGNLDMNIPLQPAGAWAMKPCLLAMMMGASRASSVFEQQGSANNGPWLQCTDCRPTEKKAEDTSTLVCYVEWHTHLLVLR